MQFAIVALIVYIIYAEWRVADLRKKLTLCRNLAVKLDSDKTVWYSGVLPKSGELCLFQETNGDYVISKLSDKRWLKKDGAVAFEKIKRWAYIGDLDNI